MWRLKLLLVYLWRIRPRITFKDKNRRKMAWNICVKTYNPAARQKLVDAIFNSKLYSDYGKARNEK